MYLYISIMTDDSIELVGRVVSTLEEYFGEVTDDHLLSMIVNLHLATNGFKDLKQLKKPRLNKKDWLKNKD